MKRTPARMGRSGVRAVNVKLEQDRVLTVTIRKNEGVDKAIRRLKKKVDREGVLKIVRQHAYYEKPSEKKLRKRKNARRNAIRMIRMIGR